MIRVTMYQLEIVGVCIIHCSKLLYFKSTSVHIATSLAILYPMVTSLTLYLLWTYIVYVFGDSVLRSPLFSLFSVNILSGLVINHHDELPL